MAQLYYSPVSINAGQVPSTQTDFPVLVSQIDARFKTQVNGGHVANANGFDIRPYADVALTTPLSYELERYNGSTGEVVMWVKVPSLSSSTTPIYLFYGDATLVTDGSSAATWSNNFLAVYHLKNGTTLSAVDAVGSFNMNISGATATAGQIDGAGNFVAASSQKIETPTNGPAAAAMTFSAWVKGTTFPNAYNAVIERGLSATDYYVVNVKSNGKLNLGVLTTVAVSYDGTGSSTLVAGTWYYLTLTYDSVAGLIGYVNAVSDHTVAANGVANTTGIATAIGYNRSTGASYWNGVLDEVRVASIARSANWITTEYNNQFAPGTFETLGTEIALLVLPYRLYPIPFFRLKTIGKFAARDPKIIGNAPSGVVSGFSELYCDPVNGSDLNGGSDPGSVATYTSTNGNWNGASIYIPTDGSNPVTAGVVVGQVASVYIDASTVGVYLARVVSVVNAVNGTITLSTTLHAGVAPSSSVTARSIKIGGAFKGPHGTNTNNWPFGVGATTGLSTLGDGTGRPVRVNMKNNSSYLLTTSHSWTTGCLVQGYTSDPGDKGKAIVDLGTTVNANIQIPASTSSNFTDMIFVSSDPSGTNMIIQQNGNCGYFRCIFHGGRGPAVQVNNNSLFASFFRECEIYDCNKQNSNTYGGIQHAGSQLLYVDNCYIHDNAGSLNAGIQTQNNTSLIVTNTIFDSNGGPGIRTAQVQIILLISNCDFYNNGSDGIQGGPIITQLFARNCNFIRNTGAGIRVVPGGTMQGYTENNAYGMGVDANGLADAIGSIVKNSPDVFYPNPWNSPSTGDFTLVLGPAIGAGYSRFTQTGFGKSGTVAHPDIGAAQANPANFSTSPSWAGATFLLPDGFIGHFYDYFWNFSSSAGSVVFTLTPGSILPPGLSFIAMPVTGEGEIRGIPTATGTYNFSVRATTGATFADAAFRIIIYNDPDEGIGGIGGG